MFPAPQISRARSSRSAQGVIVTSTEIIVSKYFRRCSMVLGAQPTQDSGSVVGFWLSGCFSKAPDFMIWGRGVHAKRHESGMRAVLLLWRADRDHKCRSLSLDRRNG